MIGSVVEKNGYDPLTGFFWGGVWVGLHSLSTFCNKYDDSESGLLLSSAKELHNLMDSLDKAC
jgi:hypothetical protein